MFKSQGVKTFSLFVVSFTVFYLGFHCLGVHWRDKEIAKDAKQNYIVLESLKNRFKLFLDYPITIGVMGAEYFASHSSEKDYAPVARKLLRTKRELLGLSLLNENGKIIQVYPESRMKKH